MDRTVVIIGGGYAGATLARELDPDFDVVLADPKDAFVHSVAALRGLVDPSWGERMFFPYDQLLTRGRVIRARAEKATSLQVRFDNGETVPADHVVLASGSSYPFPAKMPQDRTDDARLAQRRTRSILEAAERVLLVGAGPVGLELAGEVTDRWPGKQVTIVDPGPDVLGGRFDDRLRRALDEQLRERGVQLVLGGRLTETPAVPPGEPGPVTATTTSGRRLDADVWFQCYGVRPESAYLAGDLAAARRPDGFVEVDETMRVAGSTTAFAIGDVTAVPETKRAGGAMRHAGVVAANLRDLRDHREPRHRYVPGVDALIIPLGARGGASQLPGSDGTIVLDAAETSRRKGADLMIDHFTALFAAAPR